MSLPNRLPRALALALALWLLLAIGCHHAESGGDTDVATTSPTPTPTPPSTAPGGVTPTAPASDDPPSTSPPSAGPTPTGSSVGAAVTARWTFPALIPDGKGGLVFPTYLAHLLGTTIDHPFPTDLVCADVTNTGATVTATLVVSFAVYGEDAQQTVALAPGTWHVCLTPAFDATQLYALTSTTAGRIEASLLVGGATASTVMQEISIAPVDDIAWSDGAISTSDMKALAAVFVTPHDPKVDQLQRFAAQESAFGGFGDGDPYDRQPYTRSSDIPAGSYAGETTVVESGEAITWQVSSIAGGDTGTIDVYLFTPDQLTAWSNGTSQDATAVWVAQQPGTSGTFSPPAGPYALVFFNTGSDADETVTWTRNPTREDVAEDSLQSIYVALQTLMTRYSDISSSYFAGFQHVRRASEVLSTLSANCLDGSLLFASTLELVGMEPVIVFKTGHAYVGVRSAPGSDVLWPVETTMVGTSSFADAFDTGLDEVTSDSANDPMFELVDVKTARAAGFVPIPE